MGRIHSIFCFGFRQFGKDSFNNSENFLGNLTRISYKGTVHCSGLFELFVVLTHILLTWRIWWAPNNVSKWQMGFNSAFKGLKPNICTHSRHNSITSYNKTLHVSDSSSVHHQELFTVHTAMVCVIQFCWQLASRIRTEIRHDPARKLSAKLYDTYQCCVYSEKFLMMDRGTVRNM